MLDRQILIQRCTIRSHAFLLRGLATEAESAARRALELADPTDLVPDRAAAVLALANALDARGLTGDAAASRAQAATLYRAKGNLPAVAALSR